MSHRMRPTEADRYVAELTARFPELLGIDHVMDANSPEAFDMCKESTEMLTRWYKGEDVRRSPAYRKFNNGGILRPDHVGLWSRWMSCRHVYRFDAALSDALRTTESPDRIPVQPLDMLPYPIVYVSARIDVPNISARVDEIPAEGFFAWKDHDCVELAYLHDGEMTAMAVRTDVETLGEAIDHIVVMDERAFSSEGYKLKPEYREAMRAVITESISHLLYIVSDRSEQEVVYRPSGKASPRKTSPSTVHDVGVRTGRMLGQPSVRYVSDGTRHAGTDGDRRTVRAHVRSAHWHHYWVGKRGSDERRLVLRWVYPTLVAANGASPTGTVVHAAKAR